MITSLSIGPRTLLNYCNHSATVIFWRSAIGPIDHIHVARVDGTQSGRTTQLYDSSNYTENRKHCKHLTGSSGKWGAN